MGPVDHRDGVGPGIGYIDLVCKRMDGESSIEVAHGDDSNNALPAYHGDRVVAARRDVHLVGSRVDADTRRYLPDRYRRENLRGNRNCQKEETADRGQPPKGEGFLIVLHSWCLFLWESVFQTRLRIM